jgi:hypothetical protein
MLPQPAESRDSESLLSLLTAFEKGKLREYTASYASNNAGDQPSTSGLCLRPFIEIPKFEVRQ